MGMFASQQQQKLIFSLAEQSGFGCGFLKLPAAQAQIEPFGGTLLRQAGGDAQRTDIRLDNYAWLKGFIRHNFLSYVASSAPAGRCLAYTKQSIKE